MSDEEGESGLPDFIQKMLSQKYDPKVEMESKARNQQMHAALHGDRNVCEALVDAAFIYLAQELAHYASWVCNDGSPELIEGMRCINEAFRHFRKGLRKEISEGPGIPSEKLFVEIVPWRRPQ